MSKTVLNSNSNPSAQERKRLAHAIRALSMDAVQKANSGHPGAPMGMADIAEVLWNDYLIHNPADTQWANRDRFVLSNGHGSMLIYSLLHLSGYDLPIEEIKQFRQLHSKTPGHPEYAHTVGVETTTGPLGQGITNAVGFALAERVLAAQFNRPEFNIVDHYTYVFAGDGCLMEGISHEACSLAGTLGLGKLIVFYDDNGISIDGEVSDWFADDTPKRFEAYGWHVIPNVDGHDADSIKAAIEQARGELNRPTLISCKTIIGWGSPNKQGKESCHGAALGEDEVALVRETIGWEHPPFEIPEDIYQAWSAIERGTSSQAQWQSVFSAYAEQFPELAVEFQRRVSGQLPDHWEAGINEYIQSTAQAAGKLASRKASQNTLEALGPLLPELLGGSADLTGSNLTLWSASKPLNREDFSGNYIYYGVREFAMAAIMNGLRLHGGFIPYGGTFLIFSEYARNALRMAALMKVQAIYVFTHDSIGLGEDGPTHQAVEQLATLRLMPNMSVWRPCDAVETAVAWKMAVNKQSGPTSLALSRQSLEHQARSDEQIAAIERGAYVLLDSVNTPELIMIATGSEVHMAYQAVKTLQSKGIQARLVSMPSADTFDRQDSSYQQSVLPPQIRKRVAVEAGVRDYWRKYVGLDGAVVGIDRFGESAPGEQVYEYLGLTVDNIVAAAESL